jgi:hypothetical protein
VILKTSLGFSETNFSPQNTRASLLLQLLPETSVHPVLPTALIVRARFPKPESCNARTLLTRRHAPRLSPANPPVLISAAAARLLRLSCATYPRIRLVKTNLPQKYRRQKTPHAPPRAGESSGVFVAPRSTRDPYTRPDPRSARPATRTRTRALTRGPPAPRPAPTADVSPTYC